MRLSGKIALITGGSRGIGKEIAGMLAREGSVVVICARNAGELRETASAIARAGGKCMFRETDVTVEEQVNVLVRDILGRYGRLDILVNNAGVGIYKPLTESSTEDWEKVMNTNLKGAFYCAKASASVMMAQRSGIIVNVASGAGKEGFANLSIYCASKFGLLGLTDSLSKELRGYGIDVLAVTPGYTRTSFFKTFPASFRMRSSAQEPCEVARQVLIKIFASGKITAKVVRFAKEKIWT
ncbi:MAG: SDR family oxidoreductase [Nitrospirota bacterium]